MEPVRPIKINLLREEQQSDQIQLTTLISIVLAIGVLGLMGGIYAITVSQLHAEQALNKDLKARVGYYQKNNYSYQAQVAALEGIKNREPMVETLEKNRVSYLDLMSEVEKAAPRGIILYNLDIGQNSIVITGRAGDEDEVATMMAGLRASPWFKGLKTVSITSEGKDVDGLLRFDIQYGWEAVRK
ncbi:MAG: PilN domain-containing protein [Deltaproteobacteria bacterium]